MTPLIVHRYTWPVRDAIEALLGDAAGDAEAWRIRIEGDEVVIDVVAPAYAGRTIEVPNNFDVDKLCDMIVAGEFKLSAIEAPSIEPTQADLDSNEVAEINTEAPAEPPRKGGPLAQRAAISCGEKGFWTFANKRFGVGITSAEEAAAWLKTRCDIDSRVELDHDDRPAAIYREIDKLYRLWLEGYDV